jgi:hypothetical protein
MSSNRTFACLYLLAYWAHRALDARTREGREEADERVRELLAELDDCEPGWLARTEELGTGRNRQRGKRREPLAERVPRYEVRRTGQVPEHPDPERDQRVVTRHFSVRAAARRAAEEPGLAVWDTERGSWVAIDPADSE